MDISTAQVLIVGAGPTGLALALRLVRHGVPFRIIDQNSGPGLASRAMAVHARTLEFYGQLGFADEVVAQGIKIENLHVHEAGSEVAHVALREIGAGLSPYPFVLDFPQDDHERFLVGKLKAAGVEVEWNVALESLSQEDGHVAVSLLREGGGEHAAFAYLCGCDGARSRVREQLALGFEGGTYEHLYYVADVLIDGPPNVDLHAHVGENSFVLMLPVRSSGTQRLIGIIVDKTGSDTEYSFEDVRAEGERLLGVKVASVNWFSTYRAHHRVAEHFRQGRCFIAGDAGHIHSPAGGQGMNTGIGDAVNLSWKLAHVLQGRAAPALLDTYEGERIGFARTLVATTDRAFQGIVSQGLGGKLVRNWVAPHVLPFLSGFAAVRRTIFRTVSQIQIAYPDSPLSAGLAGSVEGGDRLPWISGEGQDNFAPLRTMDWQLHVYGKVEPELTAAAQELDLPLHAFGWNEAAAQAGLLRDSAYLIRPDGHVALAMPGQGSAALYQMAQRLELRFRP